MVILTWTLWKTLMVTYPQPYLFLLVQGDLNFRGYWMNLDKSKPTLRICHASDWLRHAYVTQMWPMRCEGCLSGPLKKEFQRDMEKVFL